MSLYFKIVLIIFGLAYLISPVDIIPDLLLPYIGWLDDGAVIAALIYMIRTGKLPNFIFKGQGKTNSFNGPNANAYQGKESKTASTSGDQRTKPSKTPYEILGISQGASKKQIQAAYKEAIKKYHPDKLSHLGEEFSNLANEKFLEIQDAYDTLIKSL